MGDWLVLVAVGLGTYALRVAFLVAVDRDPPGPVRRVLPHVGPAVLAAIALPGLVAPTGVAGPGETLPAFAAAAVAWLVWRRTHDLPLPLLSGLAAWWLIGAVL